MGIRIAAVAVLLIHIESTTAVIMKAIRRRTGEPRTSRNCMSDRAMRRSSPCRVMALAMKKPPMKRKMSGSAYGAKAARLSVTPTTIIAGAINRAVTEIGSTSVTQARSRPRKPRQAAGGAVPVRAEQTKPPGTVLEQGQDLPCAAQKCPSTRHLARHPTGTSSPLRSKVALRPVRPQGE